MGCRCLAVEPEKSEHQQKPNKIKASAHLRSKSNQLIILGRLLIFLAQMLNTKLENIQSGLSKFGVQFVVVELPFKCFLGFWFGHFDCFDPVYWPSWFVERESERERSIRNTLLSMKIEWKVFAFVVSSKGAEWKKHKLVKCKHTWALECGRQAAHDWVRIKLARCSRKSIRVSKSNFCLDHHDCSYDFRWSFVKHLTFKPLQFEHSFFFYFAERFLSLNF